MEDEKIAELEQDGRETYLYRTLIKQIESF